MLTEFTLTPKKCCQILAIAVIGFALAGSAVQLAKQHFGYDYLLGLIPLFSLNTDLSIPAWYSSVTLLICSLLLGIIAVVKRRNAEPFVFHWAALSLIFLYLSIDEAAGIHETIGTTLRLKFFGDTHGFFNYTWVFYGIPFVLILAACYLKFVLHLPRKTMRLFVLAGVTYIGGVLIVEMINARYADLHGTKNVAYQMMTVAEEFLEMSGIVVFIYALLSYIASQVRSISINFEEQSLRRRA